MKKNDVLTFSSPPYPTFISCGYSVFKQGELHVKRTFPSFVLIFVKSGTLYFEENTLRYAIPEQNYFIQTPHVLHEGYNKHSNGCEYFWIHFGVTGQYHINQITNFQKSSVVFSGHGMHLPKIEFNLPMQENYTYGLIKHSLDALSSAHKKYNFLTAQSFFEQILEKLLSENESYSVASLIMSKIIANKEHPTSVQSIAKEMNFSIDYLMRCFKGKYNKTIQDQINTVKLDRCIELLLFTSHAISEIALVCGYEDASSFSRWFKGQTGHSPSDYRKTLRLT